METLRSSKHWVTLDRFHLALPDAEVREPMAHAFLWANRVLFQTLVDGNLFLWAAERTAMDLLQQDGPDRWGV